MKNTFSATIVALLLVVLSGCGGSDSTTSPVRRGYAVDDYIIGGTVKFYDASGVLVYSTTTKDKGEFSWPESVSGTVKIEINGGLEDIDGSSATTGDQRPFYSTLAAIINAGSETSPIIVSAVSTGLTYAAGGDITKYKSLLDGLPTDISQTFFAASSASQSNIDSQLENIKQIQRALDFTTVVNEITDDGQLNNSNGVSLPTTRVAISTSTTTSPISIVKDIALQYCIAEALNKEPSTITQSDLSSMTSLYCTDAGVSNLKGIEAMASLEALSLNDNQIADAAPIKALSHLYYLNLSANKITTLADLNSGTYSGLALEIDRNCIEDTGSLVDSAKLIISPYITSESKQFVGCVKSDAELRRIVAKVSSTGAYVLTYMATQNALAVCKIDWGDGATESAMCDARAHTIQHAYATSPKNPVTFKVNGIIKGTVSFPGGFTEDFNGTAVDSAKWNIDGAGDGIHIGPVSVANGVAQFGAWGRISTKAKVTFSGSKIIIEAHMAGQGGSRDTSIQLVDSVSGDYVYSGDTNYSGWGLFVNATGAYGLLDADSGTAALGGSTNQFMGYRWTFEGNKITIERGPTLANITQSATRTLGRSIVGRSFYLSIGTASPDYSPGTWDWVRVSTQ